MNNENMTTPLLQAVDVSKQYASHVALKDVSVTLKEGSIHGLLGPNGAGKTTLIRIINRITAPDSGQVLIAGEPLHSSDLIKIGYLPEERGLYPKMNIVEQLLFLGQLKGLTSKQAKESVERWMKRFDIQSWKTKKLQELSKGMQQKVQFIATVLHDPSVIILDEPFSGLDPVNVNLLKEVIAELKDQGASILFSTHNMNSAEELCDEISLINLSEVVLRGEIHALKEQHKSGIYKVSTDQEIETLPPDLPFDIIEKKRIQHKEWLTLKVREPLSCADCIRLLSSALAISSFEEYLPSMNDLFLQAVQPLKNGNHE